MKSAGRPLLDVYRVLGTDPQASWAELRHRYRIRARELHPDVQAHRPTPSRLDASRATRLFSQLQEAWSLVATPELRRAYDAGRRTVVLPRVSTPRPATAPRFTAGPWAGVLLRTGPGDLHIAIPGGPWDVSLGEFLRRSRGRRQPALVIGDLPPHPGLRQALWASDFVERHRLTTMVGLKEPLEDRGDSEPDDQGAWKLTQLARALSRWAAAQPRLKDELPYGADLRLMGRLSLQGYEINLPHPGGLHTALEPRPHDRQEARRRTAMASVEVRLPPLALALVAAWSGDRRASRALAQGWSGLAELAELQGDQLLQAQRALEWRRPRQDGQEPLPGSALEVAAWPRGLEPLMSALPTSAAWLHQSQGPLPPLPWGEPISESGEDRHLSDAAARLLSRLVDRLLDELPEKAELVALRGSRLRLRVGADVASAQASLGSSLRRAMADHLGFPITPSVAKL